MGIRTFEEISRDIDRLLGSVPFELIDFGIKAPYEGLAKPKQGFIKLDSRRMN